MRIESDISDRRNGFGIGLFLVGMGLLVSGCSTPWPGVREEDPALRRLAAETGPWPVRVAVSAISIDARPEVAADDGYLFPGEEPDPHDPENPGVNFPFIAGQELSVWMADFLGDPSISPFAEVVQFDVIPPQIAAARGQVDPLPTLRLNLKVNELEIRYSGKNQWWAPKLFLWALLVLPSLPVAGEDYTAVVDFDVVLTDFLHPEKVVFQTPIRCEVTARIDDFDRGWQPLGIFRAPKNLKQWNWELILERMTPIVLRKMEIQLLGQLKDGFRQALDDWTGPMPVPDRGGL